jgi:hypothetical protein
MDEIKRQINEATRLFDKAVQLWTALKEDEQVQQ